MGIRNFLIIIAAALLGITILGIWFFPVNSDFRADNPLWNGLKDTSSGSNSKVLDSLDGLPDEKRGTTLILIPYVKPDTPAMEKLSQYLAGGGRLVLADDFGYGNAILEYLGIQVRFSGKEMLDPLANYKSSHFPRINNLLPDVLTANTDNLVFNHATALTFTTGTEVLALSSSFSFLDINSNGKGDTGEPAGTFPVIARVPSGEGQVILISDPSIFINAMADMGGNGRFIGNITATSDLVYIDQSHLVLSELHRAKGHLEKAREFLSIPYLAAALSGIAVCALLMPVWRTRKTVGHSLNLNK